MIDAGENTIRVICPRCGGDLLEWFFDLVEEFSESIGDRNMTVPCCGESVYLGALGYDWPVGFARFGICATNPSRAGYELDAGELARAAELLGHPVTQILAHYRPGPVGKMSLPPRHSWTYVGLRRSRQR